MGWLRRLCCFHCQKRKTKKNKKAFTQRAWQQQDARFNTMLESSAVQVITDNAVQLSTQIKQNIKNLSKALNDDIEELRRSRDEELRTIRDQLKAIGEKMQSVRESGNNRMLQNQSSSQKQVLVTNVDNRSMECFYRGTPVLCPSSTRMVKELVLMAKDSMASGTRDLSDREVKRPKRNTPRVKKQQDVTVETALIKPAAEEVGAEPQKPKIKQQVKWASHAPQSKPPAASSISPPSVSTVPFSVAAKSDHLASERTPAKDLTSQRKEPPQPITPQRATRPKTKPSLHTVQKNQTSTPVKSYRHTKPPSREEEQQLLRLEALEKKEQREAERRKKMEEEKKQKQMEMKRKREEHIRRVLEAKAKIDNERLQKIQQKIAQMEERSKNMN